MDIRKNTYFCGKYQYMRKILIILLIFISSCQKDEIDVIPVAPNNPPTEVVGKMVSDTINYDVFGGILFKPTNTYGLKPYGCLIVNKSNNYPVYDGLESVRFEVRNGDCSWNDNFNDCSTDRSRYEIQEKDLLQECNNKVITYKTNVYIPTQKRFKPKGGNLMVLTQVNYNDLGGSIFGALTYLVMEDNNRLLIRTHKGFSWDWNQNYTITTSPYDKWYNIRYEIKVSDKNDGYIKVFVDDVLLFTEDRPTIPTNTGILSLKFGIYNSFKSNATEPYETQVIYIDGISKLVK